MKLLAVLLTLSTLFACGKDDNEETKIVVTEDQVEGFWTPFYYSFIMDQEISLEEVQVDAFYFTNGKLSTSSSSEVLGCDEGRDYEIVNGSSIVAKGNQSCPEDLHLQIVSYSEGSLGLVYQGKDGVETIELQSNTRRSLAWLINNSKAEFVGGDLKKLIREVISSEELKLHYDSLRESSTDLSLSFNLKGLNNSQLQLLLFDETLAFLGGKAVTLDSYSSSETICSVSVLDRNNFGKGQVESIIARVPASENNQLDYLVNPNHEALAHLELNEEEIQMILNKERSGLISTNKFKFNDISIVTSDAKINCSRSVEQKPLTLQDVKDAFGSYVTITN